MPDAPDHPDLNLDAILSKEKMQLSLLDPDFYEKVAKVLKELEDGMGRVEPGSTKENIIADQLESAKIQVREIILARMHNIIQNAEADAARKEPCDAPPLLPEELAFYNTLLKLMVTWKRDRLDKVFGKRPEKIKTEMPDIQVSESPRVPNQEAHKTRDIKKYITVRLLTNVPTFVGMDNRNYTLAKEDVAMVPAVNAQALIARKAAVKLAMG